MQKETPGTDKIRPRTKSPSHKMRARQKETDQHVSLSPIYLFIYLFTILQVFPLFKAYMLGFSQVHKVSSRADHKTRNYIPYSYCNKCVGSLTFPTN